MKTLSAIILLCIPISVCAKSSFCTEDVFENNFRKIYNAFDEYRIKYNNIVKEADVNFKAHSHVRFYYHSTSISYLSEAWEDGNSIFNAKVMHKKREVTRELEELNSKKERASKIAGYLAKLVKTFDKVSNSCVDDGKYRLAHKVDKNAELVLRLLDRANKFQSKLEAFIYDYSKELAHIDSAKEHYNLLLSGVNATAKVHRVHWEHRMAVVFYKEKKEKHFIAETPNMKTSSCKNALSWPTEEDDCSVVPYKYEQYLVDQGLIQEEELYSFAYQGLRFYYNPEKAQALRNVYRKEYKKKRERGEEIDIVRGYPQIDITYPIAASFNSYEKSMIAFIKSNLSKFFYKVEPDPFNAPDTYFFTYISRKEPLIYINQIIHLNPSEDALLFHFSTRLGKHAICQIPRDIGYVLKGEDFWRFRRVVDNSKFHNENDHFVTNMASFAEGIITCEEEDSSYEIVARNGQPPKMEKNDGTIITPQNNGFWLPVENSQPPKIKENDGTIFFPQNDGERNQHRLDLNVDPWFMSKDEPD